MAARATAKRVKANGLSRKVKKPSSAGLVRAISDPQPTHKYGRVDLSAPEIGRIIGYRSVWALATLSADNKRLRGTHFTYCTLMGRNPIWGLYEIGGKCVGDYPSRTAIEANFPNHTWRRIPASFVFNALAPREPERRREEAENNLYINNPTTKRRKWK